jgi:hypothetical protein
MTSIIARSIMASQGWVGRSWSLAQRRCAVTVGAFHHPSPGDDCEAFDVVAAFDDFQVDPEFSGGPGDDAGVDRVGVAAVDPALGQVAVAGLGLTPDRPARRVR